MITSPQEYASRIRTILDNLVAGAEWQDGYLRFKTVEEVTHCIEEIGLIQKELQLVKKDVNLTMRQIHSSLTAKKADLGKPGFTMGVMQGFFGKKTVGKMNALDRETISQRQYIVLSPYQSAIQAIDEAIVVLDRLKMQLEGLIESRE